VLQPDKDWLPLIHPWLDRVGNLGVHRPSRRPIISLKPSVISINDSRPKLLHEARDARIGALNHDRADPIDIARTGVSA
jgi:hypothetical protein